jgi:hypothetical protein
MSINSTAGAIALAALLFAPATSGQRMVLATAALPFAAPTMPVRPAIVPVSDRPASHCQSLFGATEDGWGAHRDLRTCATARGEDRPHVSEHLRGAPHFYLDAASGEDGPHDDF